MSDNGDRDELDEYIEERMTDPEFAAAFDMAERRHRHELEEYEANGRSRLRRLTEWLGYERPVQLLWLVFFAVILFAVILAALAILT